MSALGLFGLSLLGIGAGTYATIIGAGGGFTHNLHRRFAENAFAF